MTDEENKPTKVAILGGNGSIGRANVGAVVAHVMEREQQVRAAEIKNRREFIASLSEEYLNHEVLAKYEVLSKKELRKFSKEFIFIHEQISSLKLSQMAKSGRGVSSVQIKKVIAALSYISHSKQFCAMNMEDSSKDYFRLILGVYIAIKAITGYFPQNNIPSQLNQRVVFISSEIGLRIYTMYIDHRMDM